MIHLDESRSAEAIEAGWLAYRARVPGFRDNYLAQCKVWRVIAVCADSQVIGALFVKDGLIHLGIIPEWHGKWASRRIIREMLSYGNKTSVMPFEAAQIEFVKRIGFKDKGNGYEFHR